MKRAAGSISPRSVDVRLADHPCSWILHQTSRPVTSPIFSGRSPFWRQCSVNQSLVLYSESCCHVVQDPKSPTDSELYLADQCGLNLSDMISLSRPRVILDVGYRGVVGTMWSISDRVVPLPGSIDACVVLGPCQCSASHTPPSTTIRYSIAPRT